MAASGLSQRKPKHLVLVRRTADPSASPDFLFGSVARANFIRLSLRKGAHATLSCAAWQDFWVRSDEQAGLPVELDARRAKQQVPPLRSPGFPVRRSGFGKLHAPLFTERRIRGSLQCGVAGNSGTLRSG
jgi:hypothetical protein